MNTYEIENKKNNMKSAHYTYVGYNDISYEAIVFEDGSSYYYDRDIEEWIPTEEKWTKKQFSIFFVQMGFLE